MILIGQNIQITSKAILEAIENRNPNPIKELAVRQAEAGADYLDLNLGPLQNKPEEIAQWVVNTVQEAVDIPLCIDTPNPVAMEAALRVCSKRGVINSANCTLDGKEKMLPLAAKYPADVILLMFSESGVPSTADERAESILETLDYANGLGIPTENIWLDAVIYPIITNQDQIKEYIEFVKIIGDVVPGAKTVTGVSNVSSCGVTAELRGILNQTFFVMLDRYGQYAGIVDMMDRDLVRLNKNEPSEIVQLIHRAMEEEVDVSSLSPEEAKWVKTVNVLLGRSIFSNSWLEL